MKNPDRFIERRLLIVGNMLTGIRGMRPVGIDLRAGLESHGWLVRLTSSFRPKLLRLLDMLWTVLRYQREYDVVLIDVFSGRAFVWAEAVSRVVRMCGRPFVFTLHGGRLPEFAASHAARVSAVLSHAKRVTAPSRYMQDCMRPYRPDITLLPNPVDLSVFRARVRVNARPRLIWVRAFHEQYNPPLAPRVASLLHQDIPDLHLTMVGRDTGDGSLARTRRTIEELGAGDYVTIIDGVPRADVARLLDTADIFLNTTQVDNTPVSVLEALACGLCVVTTNVGGIPYLVENGIHAVLVPPADPASMADAVRSILGDNARARVLSEQGVALSRTFALDDVVQRWNDLLEDVVGQRTHSSLLGA